VKSKEEIQPKEISHALIEHIKERVTEGYMHK
jgi:hypothetical protein